MTRMLPLAFWIRRITAAAVSLLLALVLVAAPAAFAQGQDGLTEAKSAGLVGERPDGLVGFVSDAVAPEVRSLVDRINAERRDRYAQIAASTGQPLEKVQAVAGDRLLQATPAGQYVMNAAGRWTRK